MLTTVAQDQLVCCSPLCLKRNSSLDQAAAIWFRGLAQWAPLGFTQAALGGAGDVVEHAELAVGHQAAQPYTRQAIAWCQAAPQATHPPGIPWPELTDEKIHRHPTAGRKAESEAYRREQPRPCRSMR